jgi:hypothetical protein
MPVKSTLSKLKYTGLVDELVCGFVALNAAGLMTTFKAGVAFVVARAGESILGFARPAIIAVALVVPPIGKLVPA